MRTTCCLLALSASLAALEEPPKVSDIRFLGGWGSEGGEITTTYHNDTTGDIHLDPAESNLDYRWGVGFFGSFGDIGGVGAPVLGVSFMQLKSTATETRQNDLVYTDRDVDVTANVYSLHAGWAVAVGPRVHLEFLAHGGYGTLNGTEHDLTLIDLDSGDTIVVDAHAGADGNYWEVGGTFGLYYTFVCKAQLGLVVDVIHGEGDSTISRYKEQDDNTVITNSFVGFSYDEEFEIDSVMGYLSLGLRL